MPALAPVGNSCLVPLQLGLCPGFFRQSGASSLPWVCPEPEEPQSPSMPSVSCPAVQQRARTELSSMHGKSCRVWGWQLRIRALWWPREGQSPSIHLAAGRALPRSPQTASGLGCSETTAFFWKDVGWRIVICAQRGWKSAGGAQGLRLIETDRAVQEAGSGQAALPALHFPTNYLSASKRKKKRRGFVRINKKLFIRINSCI